MECTGTASTAIAAALAAGEPWEAIHPVFTAGRAPDSTATDGMRAASELSFGALSLLRRHVTTPAVVVLAVTEGDVTRQVRVAADPRHPTVEVGLAHDEVTDGHEVRWRDARVDELTVLLASLLPRRPALTAPPRLTVARAGDALSLDPGQEAQARALLARGLPPAQAFSRLHGLDPRLHDALVATGPRVGLTAALHDTTGAVTERSATWSRVWVLGEQGLYRTAPARSGRLLVTPVAPGDVMGTVAPVLGEALRFTHAARSRAGGGSR